MVEAACRAAATGYAKGRDIRLYTPSRNKKFRSGTIQMNRRLRKLRHTYKETESICFGHYEYSAGDRVLFNRNNYKKGYYNGQEGTVMDIQLHNGTAHMSVESDGARISLTGSEIGDIELAYAMTAHKSQGGECDDAIILIPMNPKSLLKRRLLYVEITRARKSVLILCEKGALRQAVGQKGEIIRDTGLRKSLAELCGGELT